MESQASAARAAWPPAVSRHRLRRVGRTPQFRGIMGYLFRRDDLRRYRPVSERSHSHEAFLNFREAASVLNGKSIVVRALVHQGVFAVAPGHKNGFAKLIGESEVRAFAARYRAARRGDNRAATCQVGRAARSNSRSWPRLRNVRVAPIVNVYTLRYNLDEWPVESNLIGMTRTRSISQPTKSRRRSSNRC